MSATVELDNKLGYLILVTDADVEMRLQRVRPSGTCREGVDIDDIRDTDLAVDLRAVMANRTDDFLVQALLAEV
jgi:hypothetical protein